MVQVHDKKFEIYLSEADIKAIVDRVAREISRDWADKQPLFVATLTGAYIFMADLARALSFDAEVCFVKYTSYSGMTSTRQVRADLPFTERCRGRHVIIVEDIVDTGITMEAMLQALQALQPASISIATMLFKPSRFEKDFKIDYIGQSVPDRFVVGYGMDYDNMGRSLGAIYTLANEPTTDQKEQ